MIENTIAETLYFEIGNLNKFTVTESWKQKLSEIDDKVGFMLYNMKKFDSRYVVSLLLSFPDFLKQFTAEDWIKLLHLSFPRKVVEKELILKNQNDDGEFSDLIFLIKYLEINPFMIFEEKLDLCQSDIDNCIRFFLHYEYKFFRDEDFESDLLEFFNIRISELQDYSNMLIKQWGTKYNIDAIAISNRFRSS